MPPLVKEAYTLAKKHSFQWISYAKQILDEVDTRLSGPIHLQFANKPKQRLEDQYIQALSREA